MPSRRLRERIRVSRKMAALTDAEFRLYVLLLTCHDDYGRYDADPELVRAACFPRGGKTVRQIDTLLHGLHDKGVLDLYEIDGIPYLQIAQTNKPRAQNSKYPEPQGLTPKRAHVRTDVRKCTSITKNEERIAKNEERLPSELATDEFREAWKAWNTHRKELGHALTPTTIGRQLAKLAKWGPVKAVASIERSIEHGWRGLFEPESVADQEAKLRGAQSAVREIRESLRLERQSPTPDYSRVKDVAADKYRGMKLGDRSVVTVAWVQFVHNDARELLKPEEATI